MSTLATIERRYMPTPAHELARSRKMLTEGDVDLIQWAVKDLDRSAPRMVVTDLGAGSGTTAASVLSVRDYDVLGSTVDTVQQNLNWAQEFVTATWSGWVVSQWTLEPMPYIVATRDPRVSWRWIRSDSIDATMVKMLERCHLLLIDTSHEYEETRQEIKAWSKKVARDHYVWLDDYATYPGVKQAVDEAVKSGLLSIVDKAPQSVLCRYTT